MSDKDKLIELRDNEGGEIELTISESPTFVCKSIKRINDDYVEIDGHFYERLESGTENLDIDLEPEIDSFLNELVSSGKYVNKQDAIRTALRRAIEHGLNNEKSDSGKE